MRVERIGYNGVEGIRVGRFGSRINTTCIVYRVGSLMIDTGPPNQWAVVRQFFEERRPRVVLLTHHHEDHGGNGDRLTASLGTPIYAHQSGLDFFTHGYPLQLYRRLVWGKPGRFRPERLPALIEDDGLRLHAIHTPGHSVDLVCFHEPNRGWLFSGDLYIAEKPRYLRADEDPHLEIESLHKVLALDFKIVFCAHRGVVEEGRAALAAKLDFLVSLRQQVRELIGTGLPPSEIARRLLGKEDLTSYLTLGHFSKLNLVRALAKGDRR